MSNVMDDVRRLVRAANLARKKEETPNLDIIMADPRLATPVRQVARQVIGDMRGAANEMGDFTGAFELARTGVSNRQVVVPIDSSGLSTSDTNLQSVMALMTDADAMEYLARMVHIFPGLPLARQAEMLKPLARGQFLVRPDGSYFDRVRAHLDADSLKIPPELQRLAQVGPFCTMMGFAAKSANYVILAAESMNRHIRSLEEMGQKNAGLADLAAQVNSGFADQERTRLANLAQITELLAAEKAILDAAQMSTDSDRTELMNVRTALIQNLAAKMEGHTQAELHTMQAEAQMLQIMAVQFNTDEVRHRLLRQVNLDYALAVIAYRALDLDINLVQMMLMAGTATVREIQALAIRQQMGEATAIYQTAQKDMSRLLTTYRTQYFGTVDGETPSLLESMREGMPAESVLPNDVLTLGEGK